MGERTGYENGTFNWVELGTDDPDGAHDFYAALFGWDAEEVSAGHGKSFMCRVDGKLVAAILTRGEKQPVNAWNSYIAVDDVDATAERAAELGATIGAGPFSLGELGRMAFIADPTEAWVGLWQAGHHFGAELVNDPGSYTMSQLNTSDPAAAREFFESLFGWRFEKIPEATPEFWSMYRTEAETSLNGGMMELPKGAEWPSHWIVYFTVESVDDTAAHVTELGGTIEMPPSDIGAGRISIAQDPQGAVVAIFEGEVDP